MPHIYVTRHGESVWNVEKKVAGATDVPLTARGHEQAIELAQMIKEMLKKAETGESDFHIDEILYSPLQRAADTAKHIAKINHLPCRVEGRLIEQNFGRYEGWDRSPANKEFMNAKMEFVNHYGNGESMLELCQRVFNLMDEVRTETIKNGKNYLLVCHGGIARMIQAYFVDMTNEEFAEFRVGNCQVLDYEF